MHFKNLIFLLMATLLATACSTTKFVPEGESLLNKVTVRNDQPEQRINLNQMNAYVRQRANSRWFSVLKIPLGVYSLAGRDTSKWINRTLMAIGEPPVIYSTTLQQQTCVNLIQELNNEGFLQASVRADTIMRKRRKTEVIYTLSPGPAYHLRHIDCIVQDSLIAQMLQQWKDNRSLLKPGMQFDVKVLDAERKRITTYLTNNGYYKFNKDFITFQADSVAGQEFVDLTMVVHRYVNNQKQSSNHNRYIIRNIHYASGDLNDHTIHLRPSVLRNNTFITPGKPYSAHDLRETYNRFGRLQAVKYTNINFRETATGDSLDCEMLVSTNKPSTISFQPEGTNTAGDLGAAASLTYENRNLFRGSEVWSIELRGAFEAIKGLEGYNNENFEEYSIETKLLFPRFITPFLSHGFKRRMNATSEVSMLYDLQNRPEYHRRVLSVAWRYKWNDANHHDRYQMDLLQLNYVFMPWISSTFRENYLDDNTNRNAILRYNYEDLFIMKFGFGFSYNNGIYALKTNIETAGNLLSVCSPLLGFDKNELGQRKLFNIAFAQYVKADLDYTRNIRIDYHNTLVFHLGVGVAYPYGNSNILPFEKRYFSGGANSVRGWSVRSLGPGRYMGNNGQIDFINQTGDMKLDINLEYRTKLFWKLNGALFIDAGNIWTLRNYEDQPGGQFQPGEFWKQIAVGYGMGFRFNFDYFILRFDLGMKAINPAYETKHDHYPILHPRLRRDFTFHFAVGLPF